MIMKELLKRFNSLGFRYLLAGIALSALLSWFAFDQYRQSVILAEENLRGLALSYSAAVEAISGKGPKFLTLNDLRAPDIAYLAIFDRNGTILFHSNATLIGGKALDRRFAEVFEKGEFSGHRVRLGTGEEVYESDSPLHIDGRTVALRLALHTYRADSVIRRARLGLGVLFSLIAAAWIMGILLARFARREVTHKLEMGRREQLARLGEMGAVIAHEIRNPLAGIKGYAQLLRENLEGEDGESAGLIVGEATRLEEMVTDLLACTRSDSAALGRVCLHDALARAISIVAHEAEGSGVEIETGVGELPEVAGSSDRIEQLFLNLFRNALQAMPDGGKLTVQAVRRQKGVEVEVADTGQGIEEKNMARIFEPFFTTRARGTGLGLAICKRIADECGGEISIESRPGKGTVCTIYFPLTRS